jgi:hypothetical protein
LGSHSPQAYFRQRSDGVIGQREKCERELP